MSCLHFLLLFLSWNKHSIHIFTDAESQVSCLKAVAIYIFDVHGSVHHSTNHLEITNKMRPYVRIYYSNVYFNMFRATHCSSSEAQKL